jgi:hypothetical protein
MSNTKETSAHPCTCERGPEWSGSPNPANPDNEWICDECGAVIAAESASSTEPKP